MLGRVENTASRCKFDLLSVYRVCCGFGGTFSVSFPNISEKMGELKIENLTACKPDVVAAGDMGCMMHFGGMMDKQGMPYKRMHIAQVLRDSLKNAGKL